MAVESHLQTQRAAIKMLHERIMVLVKYVAEVVAGELCHCETGFSCSKDTIEGRATKDHAALRSLSALMASLPATESPGFREEFDTVRFLIQKLGLGVS
jgi:COP9 signalosome complex subunit 6